MIISPPFPPLILYRRERVKRRRAQAAKEDAKTPPEAPIVENKQPDVAELSKGLPSGWQVLFWHPDIQNLLMFTNLLCIN